MTMFFVAILAAGAYYAWYYYNRSRKIAAAGGSQAFADQEARKMFGLANDERVVGQYYVGRMYLGPLRPDVSPSKLEKIAAAATLHEFRGMALWVALTDRGRVAFAREMDDAEAARDQVKRITGGSTGTVPYRIYSAGTVMTAAQAFAGSPHVPKDNRGLLHLESAEHGALTFWIDPTAVPVLQNWSASRAA